MLEIKCNGHIEITSAHPAPEFGYNTPDSPFVGQVDLVCAQHTFGYKFGQDVYGNTKESVDTQLPTIGNELTAQYCQPNESPSQEN
jgi:hypothetical protein